MDVIAQAPPLLPILRSRQQAEILTYLLSDPDRQASVTDLASALGVPYASVHREVERAERAGLVQSHRVGKTRLIRADAASPYFAPLAELLTRAFGPPQVLAEELRGVRGIEAAYLFGSWAAHSAGDPRGHPVRDLDVLILGEPDRDEVFRAAADAERRLGRPVQVTIREADWLERGTGAFHSTVIHRPLMQLSLGASGGSEQPQ